MKTKRQNKKALPKFKLDKLVAGIERGAEEKDLKHSTPRLTARLKTRPRDMGNPRRGFTLIEILLVMGIIAILAAVVIVAINPARQFAQARNSQRTSNVFSILNAVSQNMADNQGLFECPAGPIPTVATVIRSTGGFDMSLCVSPTYLSVLPVDPSAEGAHFASDNDYDTAYTIVRDSTTGRITVSAPEALTTSELEKNISATR